MSFPFKIIKDVQSQTSDPMERSKEEEKFKQGVEFEDGPNVNLLLDIHPGGQNGEKSKKKCSKIQRVLYKEF